MGEGVGVAPIAVGVGVGVEPEGGFAAPPLVAGNVAFAPPPPLHPAKATTVCESAKRRSVGERPSGAQYLAIIVVRGAMPRIVWSQTQMKRTCEQWWADQCIRTDAAT